MTEERLLAAFRAITYTRMYTYSHLAKIYSGLFDLPSIKEDLQYLQEYQEILAPPGTPLGDSLAAYRAEAERIPHEDLESIEFEYNRLFVGPTRLVAPPYESVYRTEHRVVMGDTTLAVRNAYHEIGFRITRETREPDDHIAAELAYLSFLQSRCLQAIEREEMHEIRRLIRAEQAFLHEHLLTWVAEFCRMIQEGTRSAFFKALAGVTPLIPQNDVQVIGEVGDSLASTGGTQEVLPKR
ncbi:MAG: molecular chaperone TorD family protein [Alphaproteobacteria bacterium]|uniref:Molecular chaperone TorD family protein n=1 Tax=Candidatus Nitrobium versatile TaxID=2884831 RepID=A0A953JF39_9BACT|nr:molecular chaperone TorD family protein [Candidatus Nitrobium versatile]